MPHGYESISHLYQLDSLGPLKSTSQVAWVSGELGVSTQS